MPKSALTFGLLASSLVMLAIMPFLNQDNSFPLNTVMAQEYNDNYHADNSYSQYQIDDKKYECKTGPFKGFLVSSVEFCDVKILFDDDKKKKDRPIVEEPPTPTPQTASLTVNKEVFGCTIFGDFSMNCRDLQNNSPQWISCNDASISGTRACQSLNENSFDIEVLNSENNPVVEPFEGSAAGTTIPNLQPGTYTINEIESTTSDRDQLGDFLTDCATVGFPDGGTFFNTNPSPPSGFDLFYSAICFEYEEEPGNNNCNTITLAAGEQRTCTVKNYIRAVTAFD